MSNYGYQPPNNRPNYFNTYPKQNQLPDFSQRHPRHEQLKPVQDMKASPLTSIQDSFSDLSLPDVPRSTGFTSPTLSRASTGSRSASVHTTRPKKKNENDRISSTAEFHRLQVNDKVTVILKFKVGGSNPKTEAYFANCVTLDNDRVIVKAYTKQADILSSRTSTPNAVIRFVDVVVKEVKNKNNSDVNFDLLFSPTSKAELIREDDVLQIHDFQDVDGLSGASVTITGTVVTRPLRQVASAHFDVADDFGEVLTVRLSPDSFFVDAIQKGSMYSFTGTLHDSGHMELHVSLPLISAVVQVKKKQ